MNDQVQAQKNTQPGTTLTFRPVLYPLLLTGLLLLAAGLRLYHLPSLPPGLNFDEAGNGAAALEILNGAPRLWWTIGGGKEPLWPYLIALSTATLGTIPFSLRWPAALAGILTVAAVYPLLLTLFKGIVPIQQVRLIALLTMLGLAFSDWHLHFSRLGFRALLLPLFSSLAFYFLWKAHSSLIPHPSSLITRHVSRFTLYASLFTALAIYSYLAGRLLPLVPVLYFTLHWLLAAFKRYPPGEVGRTTLVEPGQANDERPTTKIVHKFTAPSFSTRHLPPATRHLLSAASYLLLTALFLLPLIIYFLLNPADFTARAGTVSIFNPAWHQGNLLGTFWQTLTTTLGTFLGFTGDANPLVNLPHQPAVPLYLAPFFVLGLIISIYHAFSNSSSPPRLAFASPAPAYPGRITGDTSAVARPRRLAASPHLFLLCWWLVMLLPALLAPEGAPHHLRLLGTLIPTYAFIALGFTLTINLLQKHPLHASRFTHSAPRTPPPASRFTFYVLRFTVHVSPLPYLLPATCYLLLLTQTTTTYFDRWPTSTDFTLPFDRYAVTLAADIAQAPAGTGYILPMDIRAGQEARHYTLDYLLGRQATDYTYILVDERNAETGLAQASAGKNELRLVRWTQDKHREADAKEIVTFLLETNATLINRESFPVYNIETYALSGNPTFRLPPINQPVGMTFDGLLRLDAAYLPASVQAGDWLPVALTLAPVAPLKADYKASIRLVAPTGERIAQKDRTLMHNFHQGTSLWPPETVNEYYLLPVPAEAPSGEYTVVVVLYHPETQAPLVAEGMVEVPVGQVQVITSND